MSIKIIDAHTHVQMIASAYQNEIIQRAQDAKIGMINAGADETSSKNAVLLANTRYNLWATVGYHPHEALTNQNFETIEILAKDKKVVGIGECGLDYFKLDPQQSEHIKREQKKLFEFHIQLAHKIQKPLVIHCRDAFTDMIQILRAHKNELLLHAGILHFFTGTFHDAKQLLDLGFSFTFGGLITFNRSFDEIIKYIPSDKILVETDAPWVTPVSYKKSAFLKNEQGAAINEPVYIIEVVKWLAKIKEMEVLEMEKILLENTKRVFNRGLF